MNSIPNTLNRMSQVEEWLGNLEIEINGIDTLTERLHHRLGSIIRQYDPEPSSPCASSPDAILVDVAEKLRNSTRHLQNINRSVDSLIERIEI